MAQIINFCEKKKIIDERLLSDRIKETRDEISMIENQISILELKLRFKRGELKDYEASYNALGIC